MKILRLFIAAAAILSIAAVTFLLFKSSEPEIYDFLENFNMADKAGFSEDSLAKCLPNFNYYPIPQEIKSIINSKKYKPVDDELSFNGGKIIKLSLMVSVKKPSDLFLKYLYGNKKDYIGVSMTAGLKTEINIFEAIGQKKREISKFAIDLDVDKTNDLYLLINEDNLLILGAENYYRVVKDESFAKVRNNGSLNIERTANPTEKIEYAAMGGNDQSILNSYNESLRLLYMKGSAPFNELSPLDDTLNPNLDSQFIKRFKASDGIVTNSALYMPVGSKLVYKNIKLDCEYKFLGRLSFAGRSDIKSSSIFPEFKIIIRDEDGKILRNYVITYKFPQSYWKEINFNLKQLKGETVDIEFIFHSPLPASKGGYNSVAILGGPCLVPLKGDNSPNVILIVLDTLRSDHLGCYGYSIPTSKTIDKFSSESIMFDNHIAAAPNTIMSHRSLFTGLYPSESGFNLMEKTVVDRSFVPFLHSFSPKITTLADYLRSDNYYTAAFTGGLYMSQNQGFDKGFHEFTANKRIKLDMKIETRRVARWLQQHKDVKFFLFFHTYEIHAPYTRDHFSKRTGLYPAGLDRKDVIAHYDSGIHYADKQIAELIKFLKRESLYENTIIIITSDHGERFEMNPEELELHPHVGIHGHSLYDCETKIPLIIGGWKKLPKGTRIDKQTRNVDILPTLLDLLDIPLRENISGQSLKNYFEGTGGEDRLAYSETVKMLGNPTKIIYSLRSSDNKLIKNYNLADSEKKNVSHSVEWEFYNLAKDPLEKKNLGTNDDLFKQQMKILEMIIAKCSEGYKKYKEKSAKASYDRQKLIDLQRLGYIN